MPALLVAGALASAAPASAVDFCVAPNTTCGGTAVGDLQNALDLAAFSNSADRIFLGAGTYTAGSTGFQYNAVGKLEIVGAGRGSTVLTAQPNGSQYVLKLIGPAGTGAHDLKVVLPPNVAQNAIGVNTNGLIDNVDVVQAKAVAERIRIEIGKLVVETEKEPLSITESIGVAAFPDDGRDRATLIERADLALYHAKHTGRNRVVTWTEAQAARSRKAG